jgi:DNA primase
MMEKRYSAMAGFLPDDFVERVREHADIRRLVEGYIPLKKAGARWRALCPFHEEKTPSFYVSPVKGLFHCFGCGVGGDAFEFVKRVERVDFPDAVRLIAEKFGLPVPEARPRAAGRDDVATNDIYDVYREAAAYYERQLWEEELGKIAREYLVSRGFGEEWARKAGLGYAPPGWENLAGHLRKKGLPPAIAEHAGLIRKSQRSEGSHYDTFRGRILFPIHTPSGKVVAFGGRTLTNAPDEPKYVNSPEHPAFHKGRTLYGLYFSRAAVDQRKFAILVEGYFDWLRLMQEGVENVVASCGTGFTKDHAGLLRRYTGKVLVNFDGDAAGRKAAMSAVEALFEADLACAVLRLPEGMDPDDYVRAQGKAAYLQALQRAFPALDFLMEELSSRHNLSTPHGKTQALNDLLPYLARIPSAIERSEYLPRIRDRFGIADDLLLSEVRRHLRERRTSLDGETVRKTAVSVSLVEKTLLVAAIEDPSRTAEIVGRLRFPGVSSEDGPESRAIPAFLSCRGAWAAIARALANGETASFASLCQDESVPAEERDFLSRLAVEDFVLPTPEQAEGAFEAIARNALRKRRSEIQEEIVEAKRAGDAGRVDSLMKEKMEISRKIDQNP